ncbi:hypothetical protein J7F03_37725, partial [Streptomyces sp. ISL-43]|uniref:RHS repeat-associated core domain-containing protein n=1 Tax=Streptomyces sp. ISL-43 TaxID=2819183 RepID=UPI001C176B4E
VDTTPPQGGTASSDVTDTRGRKVEQRQYKGGTPQGAFDATGYAYNTNGKLQRITDPAGNAWTYDYDLHGRQIKAVDPDKGTSTVTYDAADRPVSTVDARGTLVFTSYDILGRPISRNLNAVDGTKLATYDYDTLLPGQPTATTSWVDGKAWRQETTGYDIGYRSTGTKLTVPAGEGALTGTYSSSTDFDPISGAETTTEVPAAGGLPAESLSTGRNVNGLPLSYGSSTTDYVNWTNYNEYGQVQRTTFGDDPKQVVATNIQDPATGRLLSTELGKQDQSTPVDTTSYTYSPAGDVTSVTSTQGAARDTQCFAYDYLGRLTEAWTDTGTTTTKPGPSVPGIGGCTSTTPQTGKIGGSAPYWQSFTYDITGNRKTLTEHDPAGDAAKTSTTTNTYPAPGSPRPHTPTSTTKQTGTGTPVSKNLTYDNTGNTLTRPDTAGATQTLTWTSEGKLASATTTAGTSTYVYDAAGNRLARRDPGKTTLYIGSAELTRDTATDKVTGTRYYATPGGTTIIRTSTGKVSYVAADHHNTGTTAIDAATLLTQRRATKPFGEDRGTKPAAWPGERGFVGGTQDKTTGLTHLGAREYDPSQGRFLSVDPLMVVDDPRQHNAYQYANNSPLTNSDPTGLKLDDGTGHGEKADGSSPTNPLTPGGKAPDGSSGDRSGGNGGGTRGGHRGGALKGDLSSDGSRLYCDGCTSPLPQLPKGVAVPDGGKDIRWSETVTLYESDYEDLDTSALYTFGSYNEPYSLTYTYTLGSQFTTTDQYAKTYGANISVTTGFKAKFPRLAEGKIDVTVGLNGSWAWTDSTMEMKSDTQAIQTSWNVKKGDRTGLSPAGVMTMYHTTYRHGDGRLTTKTWGTFNVTMWKPVTYAEIPSNRIALNATPMKVGGSVS